MKWKLRIYKQKVVKSGIGDSDLILTGPFLNHRGEFVHEGDISNEYDVESCDSILGAMHREDKMLENIDNRIRFVKEVTSTVERHTFADQYCLYLIRLYKVNPIQGSVHVMDHEYCPWAIENRRFSPGILNGVSEIVHGFKRDEIEMIMKYLE